MSPNPMRWTPFGGMVIVLAFLASNAALAADATAPHDSAPTIVAQAGAATTHARVDGMSPDTFPPHQRGVRQAAAQSNEALRRYIWRTRMIYNFYYNDFAPKE